MRKFFTALLMPALLIGITPRYSFGNPTELYPGEDFRAENSEVIFGRIECLKRGGASSRQIENYLTQELKKYNIEPSYYRQVMTKERQKRELESFSQFIKRTYPNFCETIQKQAFHQSEDGKHFFTVVQMEKNLSCINQVKKIRDDVSDKHVDRWLYDNQKKNGIAPAIYNRLLEDKLVMPKWLDKARANNCLHTPQKVAVSLFLKKYMSDSSTSKIPVNQLTASDFKSQHQRCKEVRDYQGCMNYKNNGTTPTAVRKVTPAQDYCPDDADGWCIAGEGRDRFNMRKMKGWEYKEFNDGDVLYIDPIARRVPHKGQPDRYIAERQVFRYYSQPTAGIPGSYTTIGSASTNCTDYGSMINCTTTPPAQIYSPGMPGSAGGVKSIERTKVVDCVDETSSLYIGNKAGKWKPVNKNSALFSYCEKRTTLPPLEMKL